MDRTQFEALRDAAGKYIEGDVRLVTMPRVPLMLAAEEIVVHNSLGVSAMLNVTFHPEVGGFKCNVHVRGLGPICRLEINGPEHRGVGRTHKHALRTERCPRQNLHRDVTARPDLHGVSMKAAWELFCGMAFIDHRGSFSCDGVDTGAPL
jgi:hypothetical protein